MPGFDQWGKDKDIDKLIDKIKSEPYSGWGYRPPKVREVRHAVTRHTSHAIGQMTAPVVGSGRTPRGGLDAARSAFSDVTKGLLGRGRRGPTIGGGGPMPGPR